jgi:hypothetical protein
LDHNARPAGRPIRRRPRKYRQTRVWLLRKRHRWRDRSLTLLLAAQIVTVFGVVPAIANGLSLPTGLPLVLLLFFMSLAIAMARDNWAVAAGLCTFAINLACAGLRQAYGGLTADVLFDVGALLTLCVVSIVVATIVFRPGRFTYHRVRGAIVLYLNLGLMFALLHQIIAQVLPGAYTNLPNPEHAAAFRAALDYFSFSTLTSVGYGDIVPVQPIARGLATLEAGAGQLLPTLLIGRVVVLAMRE